LVVSGAIQGARDLGLDVAKAASAAANGAIKGAGDISLTAVDQVTQAVTQRDRRRQRGRRSREVGS
jgi:hypothetical protein